MKVIDVNPNYFRRRLNVYSISVVCFLQIRTLGYSVMVNSVLLSASFRDLCNEFNVDIQRTAPYRHHQLARIERHWRTIVDAVTALLTDAALAKSFWGYAFLTVSYVRNRVWHSKDRIRIVYAIMM